MKEAVSTEVGLYTPEEYSTCCRRKKVFFSDKRLLCDGLFTPMPPGMDPEGQLPNVGIWKEGVEPDGNIADGGPYTFVVDSENPPKKSDVISYNGRLYIIGDVHTVEDPYLEIEPEVLWVYPDWAVDNDVYSNTRWKVK